MAISFIGNTRVDASAGNGSTTITIPTGATEGVLQLSYWDTGSGIIATATVDSQTVTNDIAVVRSGNNNGVYLGTVTGFTTGASKTVSWTWGSDQAVSEGGYFYITWWSGVDTTTPLSDSGWDRNTTTTDVSVTVTTAANEVVVAHSEAFHPNNAVLTPDGSPTLNSVYNNDNPNDTQHVDVDYYTRTQATHVNTMTGENYSSMIVGVLKVAAAGGNTVRYGLPLLGVS